ncbi:SDR family oxidoreductase [Xanthomonas sp. WHRI 8391]|uniref:NADPH-dependent reductase BacG n=1 Tax=Xanthomonas hortorum pv. carotae TaxID=487904 RepID=A0A6V7BWC1_9XANT|nr:SDR family oxidoreductase [Xanthomonas hortorum]ETC90074.1 3-oxoacyl-[acyl-carrier protein] reductase [Xanthomonas hortorum pv. carotae str. M081]MBG3851533.1 SDR family oxidoreductase [Xanthomonas hortorum pv. carotae]UTS73935.1 SDR family oxidoreductase [Xanthomonas hortorum]CAD0306682.1 NADPH-dependent reductase BacG [Xanthomonas hortorum pv. carotae]CAD0306690.1 NADPH-dependent reductase BacG [Xanthomonas hortorum pv. carotae]
MDLGIAGRWALVCAASKGLGLGCARALASEGVNVVIVARGRDALEQSADALRALPGAGEVRSVVADIATPQGRTDALAACPQVDILINNAGGPPPGDFRQWERDDWLRALDANMLAPIELIRASVDAMRARRFGRIINITSSAVKAPIDILGLSNGARAGLTGFVAGLARSTVADNVTINNLLPGQFATDRLRGNFAAIAQQQGGTAEDVAERKRAGIPAGRFGEPDEFGAACAFLCSAQAGYITGQNLLIDGGSYPGTF